MRGHRVVRDGHLPGYVSGRKTVGLVLHQEAKHLEASGLSEGSKGQDDVL